MNKRYLFRVLATAAVLGVLAVGASYLRAQHAMGCRIPVSAKLTTANSDFAFRLFKDIASHHPSRNVLISPCGVSLALTLACDGALGDTRKAIGSSLGLDRMRQAEVDESNEHLMANLDDPGAGVQLAIANAAWLGKRFPVEQRFTDTARQYYEAEVASLDFTKPGAASTIDKWVSDKTQGRIDHIAEGLDDLTVLCLTNAVYFNGTWTHRFDKQTREMPFRLADGSCKNVPMMFQHGAFRYLVADTFEAIALPYGRGRTSMYVFVPRWRSDLLSVSRLLSTRNWQTWMSGFRLINLDVCLPRWKNECQSNLKPACARLGMGIAFDESKSDFRGIFKGNGLNHVYISVLKQKDYIEVNEEGTEAAATTVENLQTLGVASFRADRPFLYVVRDDRIGAILFIGSVVDPTLSKSEP